MALLSDVEWNIYDPLIFAVFLICIWVSPGYHDEEAGQVLIEQVVLKPIYNILFHPLRNIPGPLFARATSWPSAYHAKKGDRHVWLQKCFDAYGNNYLPHLHGIF